MSTRYQPNKSGNLGEIISCSPLNTVIVPRYLTCVLGTLLQTHFYWDSHRSHLDPWEKLIVDIVSVNKPSHHNVWNLISMMIYPHLLLLIAFDYKYCGGKGVLPTAANNYFLKCLPYCVYMTMEQTLHTQSGSGISLMLIHDPIHQKKCQVLSNSICIMFPFYLPWIPTTSVFSWLTFNATRSILQYLTLLDHWWRMKIQARESVLHCLWYEAVLNIVMINYQSCAHCFAGCNTLLETIINNHLTVPVDIQH